MKFNHRGEKLFSSENISITDGPFHYQWNMIFEIKIDFGGKNLFSIRKFIFKVKIVQRGEIISSLMKFDHWGENLF